MLNVGSCNSKAAVLLTAEFLRRWRSCTSLVVCDLYLFCQPSPRLPNAEAFYPKAAQVCREAGRTQLLSDLEARVGKLADLEARLDKSNKQEARLDKSTRGNKRKKQHKDKDERNSKIVGLCGAGQWEEALQLFSEMSLAKATPRQKTYSCLVYALQQSQQWQLVLHLLGDMPAGMTTDKMVDAIFFDRTIGLEGLTSLLCEMRVRKVTPNAALLTECIVACGVAQEWQRALDVLGDRPTTVTYTAAISACDSGNEPLQALALLQEMHQKEITPNSYTYTSALAACCRGGYWQFALHLLGDMPAGMTTDKMADAIFFDRTIGLEGLTSLLCEMRVRKVTPNAALLTECIVACGVAQEWQRALDVLGDRRTTSTYSAAISACDRGNEPLQALALLQDMQQKEIAPNSYTYTGALAACRRGGYWQFALQLLQQMKEAQLAPAIENYGAALSACSAPRSHSVGLCSHSLNIFVQTFRCMWLSWRSATIVSFIMFRT